MNLTETKTDSIDSDGNITGKIEKYKIQSDKNLITVEKNEKGNVVEHVKDEKGYYINIYSDKNIKNYISQSISPIAQIVPDLSEPNNHTKMRQIEYDGAGNTFIYARIDDTWAKIAKHFNMSVQELKSMNKDVKTIHACVKIKIKSQYNVIIL